MYRVLKFGGSSVANATRMSRVLDIVEQETAKGRVVLVSSAISGCTDAFLSGKADDVARMETLHRAIVRRLFTGAERTAVQQRVDALFEELRQAPQDEQVTYGEILSTTLLAAKLEAEGYRTVWLDSRRLVVKDDLPETYRRIAEALQNSQADLFVAPGFICSDSAGKVCTLGRGGSDYSAALYAAAVNAESLQIWTDVPGIMSANPKQVPAAHTLPNMSYASALDMASHGAKVLYAPTVAPAMEKGIAIEIRNTFAPEGKYTVISAEEDPVRWVGLASAGDTIRLTGGQSAAQDVQDGNAKDLIIKTLREEGIAALSIHPDGTSLDIEVRDAVLNLALNALHRVFFQDMPVQDIPLYVAGNGAVAKALLQMVEQTAATVQERTGKRLQVVGQADSRHYGLGPGAALDREGDFVSAVLQTAPKGALFVDVTNSETLYTRYPKLLQAGIGIVSSNRRSFAVPYPEYAALHTAARENGAVLRYETTVGAALPVLESIARGANSCDRLLSIEAVVSCTLNQILGEYRPGGASFASLVRKAHQAGLTEPDPRQDLGGRDALRKLLILSREAGVQLEEADVEVEPVVPLELFQGTLEQFFEGLEACEAQLSEAFREAERQGFRRRFVASLEKTGTGYRAGIGIRNVPPVHPAYHLRGTENAIIVRSAFHPYPLVIQGPGEGAREAASSILNDILR